MTKLNALNKYIDRLGKAKSKTLLEAVNTLNVLYGGEGRETSLSYALNELVQIAPVGKIVKAGPYTFDFAYSGDGTHTDPCLNISFTPYLIAVDFTQSPMTVDDGYLCLADSNIEVYSDNGLTAPDAVTIEGTFKNCKLLKTVSIKKAMTNLGQGTYMFAGCTRLEDVDLEGYYWTPQSNGNMATEGLFTGCTNLKTINMPNVSFEYLGDGDLESDAFRGCENLTHITFAEGKMFDSISTQAEGKDCRIFQFSPLDRETAIWIINNMVDHKASFGSSAKLYFSEATVNALSEDDKTQAETKGWTITAFYGTI